MILIAQALARLVGFVLVLALAFAGAAVAVFSIQAGSATLSLPNLASLLALPELRDSVGAWLTDLEGPGPVATVAAAAGAGAVLLGLVLLAGALLPRRERLVIIERSDAGILSARRRAVATALRALAEQPRDVVRAKARVRPRRRGLGGRARLTVYHAQTAAERTTAATAKRRVTPLADRLSLRLRTRTRVPRRGARVR